MSADTQVAETREQKLARVVAQHYSELLAQGFNGDQAFQLAHTLYSQLLIMGGPELP